MSYSFPPGPMRFGRIVPVLLLALAFVAGCELLDPNPGPSSLAVQGSDSSVTGYPTVKDTLPPTAACGAQLYAQYCSRCHGDSAEGSLIWPSTIQNKTGIHDVVHSGRRAMPGFPNLSDSGIASIELFLGTFVPQFDNKTGRELYVSYCKACHGDSGLGTTTFAGSIQGHGAIGDIVRLGRGEMKAVDIPDSIITKIQEYLLTLKVDMRTLSGVEYYARECARCHGAAGEGTTRGYEIRNPVTGYATWVIRNGRPGAPFFEKMPKYGTDTLSAAQLTEMLNWLRSAAHPNDGKLLYNRFCLSCHGANARGGIATNKNIREELDEFAEKIREGEGGNNYASRSKYMPKWSASEMSDAEIDLIVNYVRALR